MRRFLPALLLVVSLVFVASCAKRETPAEAALREVLEETGLSGEIAGELGVIDFWFMAGGKRIHKTVHHYLFKEVGGTLSPQVTEVDEVRWFPLEEIVTLLAYPDEKKLIFYINLIIQKLNDKYRKLTLIRLHSPKGLITPQIAEISSGVQERMNSLNSNFLSVPPAIKMTREPARGRSDPNAAVAASGIVAVVSL